VAIATATAIAGCRSTAGLSTAPPAPVNPPPAPTVTAATVTPPAVVTPKPGNPTPIASASSIHGTVLSNDLVDVLAVRCDEHGLELASDRVRAARDGVHLLVSGTAGYTVGLEHEFGGGSVDAGDASSNAVELIAPGTLAVGCGLAADPWPLPGIDVRVEDPDGVYRSYMIGMGAHACVSGNATFTSDARGAKARPVKQAKAALRGLRPGDIVQRAGYPVETGRVRVVRDGEVIASFNYEPDGHGGWLLEGATTCDGLSAGS
jgi:hypothetical protein